MKKKTLFTTLFLGVILLSCKKEELKNLDSDNSNYTELQGEDIITKIKNFKNETVNPTSESQISLENAIWLAEASVNYDFDYSGTMHNQTSFSTQLDWNIDLNAISKTDATSLYKQVKTVVSDYVAKNNNNKIKLIDIEAEGKQININIVSGTTTENSRIPAECTPFGTTDYWNWYSGKCDAYSGQGLTATELMKKLNAQCVSVICQNGGNIVYTNISTTILNGITTTEDNTTLGVNILNPFDITSTGDGITDYCLYYGYGSLAHMCLAPAEMNAYVSSIKYLANLNKPANKEIIQYTLYGEGYANSIFHTLHFTSGTKTCYLETN